MKLLDKYQTAKDAYADVIEHIRNSACTGCDGWEKAVNSAPGTLRQHLCDEGKRLFDVYNIKWEKWLGNAPKCSICREICSASSGHFNSCDDPSCDRCTYHCMSDHEHSVKTTTNCPCWWCNEKNL